MQPYEDVSRWTGYTPVPITASQSRWYTRIWQELSTLTRAMTCDACGCAVAAVPRWEIATGKYRPIVVCKGCGAWQEV